MIARLWASHRALLIGFVLAVLVALFLGARAILFTLHWSDPATRDQAIAGWMTPRYVAHSWSVPPEVVGDAVGLAQDGRGRRVTLDELAAERGVDLATLTAELTTAIARFRAAQ